jgi:NAD+ synthase (glutamine-hydrolysing)
MIAMNGKVISQGSQFSIKEREIVTATIDLEEIRNYRRDLKNRGVKNDIESEFHRVYIDFDLCQLDHLDLTDPQGSIRIHSPEEEIFLGPPLWLWDYLRRSGARGFFLPLSGGLDSASVATMVGSMCHLVFTAIEEEKDEQVLSDLRSVVKDLSFTPSSPKDIAKELLVTTYMGTKNSSSETLKRAKSLADDIGCLFYD